MEHLESKAIAWLRFPLIVGILLIHNNYLALPEAQQITTWNDDVSHIINLLEYICGKSLAAFCVPMFFTISGFLFFYNSDFSLTIYRNKLKRRVRSLLIPYLLWNIWVFILLLIIKKVSFGDLLYALWDYRNGMPVASQFWFIRDLMKLCIISPLIYFGIKFTRGWGIIPIGIYWVVTGGEWGLFFFSLGALLSIRHIDICQYANRFRYISFTLYPFLIIADTYFREQADILKYVHPLFILCSISVVFSLALSMVRRETGIFLTKWGEKAFFLFAMHEPTMAFMRKAVLSHVDLFATSIPVSIAFYFIGPFVTIIISLVLFRILSRFLPSVLNILIGGR